MRSIMMQGDEFGRIAGEAILRRATSETQLKRLVAAFQIFLGATVALKRQEGGKEAASQFDQAALAALGRRIALFRGGPGRAPEPRHEIIRFPRRLRAA
ncbi:MAG: hypothetical protein ABWY78_18100 [Microvirga sp.]